MTLAILLGYLLAVATVWAVWVTWSLRRLVRLADEVDADIADEPDTADTVEHPHSGTAHQCPECGPTTDPIKIFVPISIICPKCDSWLHIKSHTMN